MTRTRIKICGITTVEAAHGAVEAGADAIGFVFVADSPRNIDPGAAAGIMGGLAPFVSTVGLFRNPTLDEFLDVEQRCPTAYTQLHGTESEKLVRQCGPLLIKAVQYERGMIAQQLARWDAIEEVDAILVDGSPGGEGAAFDWTGLRAAGAGIGKPLILAGGLTPENVGTAIRAVRPYGVDVSSGVERSRGVKDVALIKAFCEAVRETDSSLREEISG